MRFACLLALMAACTISVAAHTQTPAPAKSDTAQSAGTTSAAQVQSDPAGQSDERNDAKLIASAREELKRFESSAAKSSEHTCYSIRSYVVARNSKDSDAVHPVSYKTCVPSNKVEVKTTVMHSATP